MTAVVSSISVLILTISILYLSNLSSLHAQQGGFSLKLIHRDSPGSPLYDPSETHYQRLYKSFRRSSERAHHIHHIHHTHYPNDIAAKVQASGGTYVMNFSIGSPPVSTLAIADTGSDLIWTQCKPCDNCFPQDMPFFDPKLSTSYRDVACDSEQCIFVEGRNCDATRSCNYKISYGDKSYSYGKVGVEKLTLESSNGRPVAFPRVVFGCGHQSHGTFSKKSSGIVGLGGGKNSLISQLGSSIGGKFSYCLAPLESNTSTLNFGTNAIVSGSNNASTTPLLTGSPDTFYYLMLEAVSVGNNTIKYDETRTLGTSDGNIIIDSGTTLTMFPPEFFAKLKEAMAAQIDATPIPDPEGFLGLCYKMDDKLKLPKITMHFKNADVELKNVNSFIAVTDDTICFTFKENGSGAIYGNLAQLNFLVGYDKEKKTLSFKPTDCSQH
ncbi:hypothetical protein ACFE04_028154 [Oxalis oulophora]